MMILVSLAYYISILKGETMQHQNVHQYVARPKESGRQHRRHSAFAIGLSASSLAFWGESLWELIDRYISFNPQKLPFYKRGVRAIKLAMAAV
jgi:hypothetical protein